MVHTDVEFDVQDIKRFQLAIVKRKQVIADQIARLAEKKAEQYARDRTPGTTYDSFVEIEGDVVKATLEADPRSEGAEINLLIAIGGRKAYTIRPKHGRRSFTKPSMPGRLVWPAGVKGDPVDGSAFAVHKKAIPPVLAKNFLAVAMKNAIVEVTRRYR